MAVNVASYIKNLGLSVAYSTADAIKDTMPSMGSFMEQNKDLTKVVYKSIIDYKVTLDRANTAIKGSKIFKAADSGIANIKDDILSGKFYNKERINSSEEKAAMDFAGDDEFFDDSSDDINMDFGSDFEDGDSSSDIIESAVKDSAEMTAMTVARSSECIIENQRNIASMQYTQNVSLVNDIRHTIGNLGNNISEGLTITNDILKTHIENAKQFYESTNAMMVEQNTMLKELLEMSKKKSVSASDREDDKSRFSDITSDNMPDLKKYFKIVTENAKNQIPFYDVLFGNAMGDANMLEALVASPLQFIPDMIAKMLVPASLGVAMKNFDKSLSGLFGGLIARMNKMQGSDNPILSAIGRIFGIDNSLKLSINNSNYEKGAIPFDGITKKSIVEIIPGYLRRIEGLLSGTSEKIFDLEAGKWTTVDKIQEEFDNLKKNSIRSGSGDVGRSMRKMLGKTRFSSKEQQDKVQEDFNKIFEKVFMDGGQFDPYGNFSGGDASKDDMYLEYGVDSLSFDLFMKMWEAIPKSTRNTLARSMVSARDRHTKNLTRSEKEGTSVFAALFNGDDLNSNIKKNNYGDIEESFGLIGNGLLNAKDNFGNNVFYYLQGMFDDLAEIRLSLTGGRSSTSKASTSSGKLRHIANNVTSSDKKKTKEELYNEEVKSYNDSWKDLDDDSYIKLDYYGMSNDELLNKASLEYIKMQEKMSKDEINEFKGKDSSFDDDEADEQKSKKNAERASRLKKGNLLERLLAAETLTEKAQAITDSLYNLSTKPAEMLGSILAKADARIYDFMFGKEVKDERDERGNPIRGFFDHMILKINGTFDKIATYWKDHIIEPLKNKFSELMDGLAKKLGFENFDNMKDTIKKKLFDEDEGLFGNIVGAIKDNFKGAWGEVKDSFKSVKDEATEKFNEYMGIEKPEEEEVKETQEETDLKKKKEDLIKAFNDKAVKTEEDKLNHEAQIANLDLQISKQKLKQTLTDSGVHVPDNILKTLDKANNSATMDYAMKKITNYLNSDNIVVDNADSRATNKNTIANLTKKVNNAMATSKGFSEKAKQTEGKVKENQKKKDAIAKAEKEAAEQRNAIIASKEATVEVKTNTGGLLDYARETLEHIKNIASAAIDLRDIINFKFKTKEEREVLRKQADEATKIAFTQMRDHAENRSIWSSDYKHAKEKGYDDTSSEPSLIQASADVARAFQDKPKAALRVAGVVDRDSEYDDIKKNDILDTIEENANGARMITKSGITTISKGEMVIPSDLNPFNPDRDKVDRAAEIENEKKIKNDFASRLAEAASAIRMNANGDQPVTDDDLLAKYNGIDINKASQSELHKLAASMADHQMELDRNAGKSLKSKKEYFDRALASIKKDQKPRSITEAIGKSDFAQVGAEAIDRLVGGDSDKKTLSEAFGEAMEKANIIVPDAIGKGLVGGTIGLFSGLVGGPLLGAGVGAATAFISKSEKAQKWLFGDKILDENGNDTGKRTGGVFSAELQDTVKKYFPDMKKYGIVGGVLGLAGPMGPIGGLLMGSAIGYVKNNDRVREAMFGDEGLLSKDRRDAIKKAFPSIAAGTLAGLFMGPFGIMGNAVLGSALGFASTTDGFKDLVLGEMNDDGEREGGIVGALKDNIVDPIKEAVIDLKDRSIDFITEKLIQPITDAMKPLAKQFSLMVKGIGSAIVGGITGFMNSAVLNPIGNLVKEKVLDPIANVAKTVSGVAFKLIGGVISAPSRLIGGLGNMARKHQIKIGEADYMSAEDRIEYRKTHHMGLFNRGKNAKWAKADESIANMDAESVNSTINTLSLYGKTDKDLDKEKRKAQREGFNNLNKYFSDAGISGKARTKLMKKFVAGENISEMIAKYAGRDGKRLDQDTRASLIDQMSLLRKELNTIDEQKKSLKNLKKDPDGGLNDIAKLLGVKAKDLTDKKVRNQYIRLLRGEKANRIGFNDEELNETLKNENPFNAELVELNTAISDKLSVIVTEFPKLILESGNMSEEEKQDLMDRLIEKGGGVDSKFVKDSQKRIDKSIEKNEKQDKKDQDIKDNGTKLDRVKKALGVGNRKKEVKKLISKGVIMAQVSQLNDDLIDIISKSDGAFELIKNAAKHGNVIYGTKIFTLLSSSDLARLATVAKYRNIPNYTNRVNQNGEIGKDLIDNVLGLSASNYEKISHYAERVGTFPMDEEAIKQALLIKDTRKSINPNLNLGKQATQTFAKSRTAFDNMTSHAGKTVGHLANMVTLNPFKMAYHGAGAISNAVGAAYNAAAVPGNLAWGLTKGTVGSTAKLLGSGIRGIGNIASKKFNPMDAMKKFTKLGVAKFITPDILNKLGKTGCAKLIEDLKNYDPDDISDIKIIGHKAIIETKDVANEDTEQESLDQVAGFANGGESDTDQITAISKGELVGKKNDLKKLIYNAIDEKAEGDVAEVAGDDLSAQETKPGLLDKMKNKAKQFIVNTRFGIKVYEQDSRGGISEADSSINAETDAKEAVANEREEKQFGIVNSLGDWIRNAFSKDEEEEKEPWTKKLLKILGIVGIPIAIGVLKDDILPRIMNFKEEILDPFMDNKVKPFINDHVSPWLKDKLDAVINWFSKGYSWFTGSGKYEDGGLPGALGNFYFNTAIPFIRGEGEYQGRGLNDLILKGLDILSRKFASGMEFLLGDALPVVVTNLIRYLPQILAGTVRGIVKGLGSILTNTFGKTFGTDTGSIPVATSKEIDKEIPGATSASSDNPYSFKNYHPYVGEVDNEWKSSFNRGMAGSGSADSGATSDGSFDSFMNSFMAQQDSVYAAEGDTETGPAYTMKKDESKAMFALDGKQTLAEGLVKGGVKSFLGYNPAALKGLGKLTKGSLNLIEKTFGKLPFIGKYVKAGTKVTKGVGNAVGATYDYLGKIGINSLKEGSGELVDDVAKEAVAKAAKDATGDAVAKAAKNAAKDAITEKVTDAIKDEVVDKVDDAVSGAAKSASKNKTLIARFLEFVSKAISKFFHADKVVAKIKDAFEAIGKKITKPISVVIDKMVQGLVKKLISALEKTLGKTVAKFVGKITAALGTGGLIQVADAVVSFTTGFMDADAILGIKDPSFTERFIGASVKAVNQSLLFGILPEELIVDIFVEYIAPMFNMDMEEFNKRREAVKQEVAEYNATKGEGEQLNIQEYLNKDKLRYQAANGIKDFFLGEKNKDTGKREGGIPGAISEFINGKDGNNSFLTKAAKTTLLITNPALLGGIGTKALWNSDAMAGTREFLGNAWDKTKALGAEFLDNHRVGKAAIDNSIDNAWNKVKAFGADIMDDRRVGNEVIGNAWNKVKAFGADIIDDHRVGKAAIDNSIYNAWNSAETFIGNTKNKVKALGDKLLDDNRVGHEVIGTAIYNALKGLGDTINKLKTNIDNVGTFISDGVKNFRDNMIASAKETASSIKESVSNVTKPVFESLSNVGTKIANVANEITDRFKNILSTIKEFIDKIINKFKNFGKDKIEDVKEGVKLATDKAKSKVADIKDATVDGFNKGKNFVTGLVNKGINAFGFANGTTYVDRTGLTSVSKGEMIVPSDLNPFNPNRYNVDRFKEILGESSIIQKLLEGNPIIAGRVGVADTKLRNKIINVAKKAGNFMMNSPMGMPFKLANKTIGKVKDTLFDSKHSSINPDDYISEARYMMSISDTDLKLINDAKSNKIAVFGDQYIKYNPSNEVKNSQFLPLAQMHTGLIKLYMGIPIALSSIVSKLQPVIAGTSGELQNMVGSMNLDIAGFVNNVQGIVGELTNSIETADSNAASGNFTEVDVDRIVSKTKSKTNAKMATKKSSFISNIGKNIKSFATNAINKAKSWISSITGRGEADPYNMYEYQNDPSMRDMSFNSANDSVRQTMGDSGCGPVVAANLINTLAGQKVVDSETMAKVAISGNYKEANSGVRPDFFTDIMNRQGIGSSTLSTNEEIDRQLSSGKPTVLLGTSNNNGPFTEAGHYLLATGKDSSGNIIVNDPRRKGVVKYNKNTLLNSTELGIGTGSGTGVSISNIINRPLGSIYNYVAERLGVDAPKLNTNSSSSTSTNKSDSGFINGNEITLPSGLGRYFTFMGWQCITSKTSMQYKLRQKAGMNFDSEGFGVINGRYVVATTTTFGKVGDYIDVYQSDGTVFKCIIGDIKSQGDAGCTKWGHENGQVVVEFIVDKNSWYSSSKGGRANSMHANPGSSSFHPEWGGKTIVKIVNGGSYFNGSGTGPMHNMIKIPTARNSTGFNKINTIETKTVTPQMNRSYNIGTRISNVGRSISNPSARNISGSGIISDVIVPITNKLKEIYNSIYGSSDSSGGTTPVTTPEGNVALLSNTDINTGQKVKGMEACHPKLQALAARLIEEGEKQGLKIRITESFRTVERQDQLYAQGRTAPGNIVTNAKGSSYQSMHQWGIAFDICRNDGKGAFNDNDGWFGKVAKIGKALGLEWGGDWTSPVDKPHFQLSEWGSTPSALKKKYGNPDNFRKSWNTGSGLGIKYRRPSISKLTGRGMIHPEKDTLSKYQELGGYTGLGKYINITGRGGTIFQSSQPLINKQQISNYKNDASKGPVQTPESIFAKYNNSTLSGRVMSGISSDRSIQGPVPAAFDPITLNGTMPQNAAGTYTNGGENLTLIVISANTGKKVKVTKTVKDWILWARLNVFPKENRKNNKSTGTYGSYNTYKKYPTRYFYLKVSWTGDHHIVLAEFYNDSKRNALINDAAFDAKVLRFPDNWKNYNAVPAEGPTTYVKGVSNPQVSFYIGETCYYFDLVAGSAAAAAANTGTAVEAGTVATDTGTQSESSGASKGLFGTLFDLVFAPLKNLYGSIFGGGSDSDTISTAGDAGGTSTTMGSAAPPTSGSIATYLYNAMKQENPNTNFSSHYGEKRSGYTHNAIDIGTGKVEGKSAYMPVSGTVAYADTCGGGGNTISVRANDGFYHTIMHMKDPTPFKVGDTVKAGQAVGIIGGTSASSAGAKAQQGAYATHLHYQIRKSGPFSGDPINPEMYSPGDNPGPITAAGPNMLSKVNRGREIGGPLDPSPDSTVNYTELIKLIIELLTKVVNNTAAISKLCDILENSNSDKVKSLAKEIKNTTTGKGESENVDFNNIKRKLNKILGSNEGIGAITVDKDISYIANAMKKIVTE